MVSILEKCSIGLIFITTFLGLGVEIQMFRERFHEDEHDGETDVGHFDNPVPGDDEDAETLKDVGDLFT